MIKIENMASLFDASDLDELVHAQAAKYASEVNNDGPEVQLTYLLKRGMTWNQIMAYSPPRFDELTHCGPDFFPEARLCTEVLDESETYLLFWHAASMTEVDGTPHAEPADDCNLPCVVDAFGRFNTLPPNKRVAIQNPKTGQHYLAVWAAEDGKDGYSET